MSGRVSVKVDWKGPEVVKATKAAARKALWLAAENILNEANQLVPLDTGILQASGETHMSGMPEPDNGPLSGVSKRTGKQVTVVRPPLQNVEAGDLAVSIFYNTPYAVRLHEHPGYEFQGGREGKWLEKAVNENADDVLKQLAADLAKEF